jgi:GT2 family glycosyltransferase
VVSGAFREAISYMDAMPHIGLAGTKLINPHGTLHESVSYRYPGQKYPGSELSSLKGSIACVQGSSMIVRSDVMKAVGGFDEDFFLYGEDQDLCLRIRKLGFEIGYIEDAVVVHVGGIVKGGAIHWKNCEDGF